MRFRIVALAIWAITLSCETSVFQEPQQRDGPRDISARLERERHETGSQE
jgi:hypothetical protein